MIDINKIITLKVSFDNDLINNKDYLFSKIKNSSCLIIGGAGTIGSNYVKELLEFKPSNLVVVDVNENDILRVNLGDYAEVNVDAYMKDKFQGVVTEIANSANLIGTSADQVTNFEVKIRIEKSSYEHLNKSYTHPFRPGMTASVDIRTEIKENIKLVSIQSVTTRKDSSSVDRSTNYNYTKEFNEKEAFECVFIHKNGKALIKSVETGIQDDQNIEIISGLNEGDEVIKAPYSAVSKKLRNEMPISIEN